MPYRQLGFVEKKDGRVAVNSDKKWLTTDLLGISPSASDIYNAFIFLIDKGFIASRERSTAGTRIFVGIRVADIGLDIVEGIEGSSEGRRDFSIVFNIQVREGTSVDELVKDKLSKLLGSEG